MSESGPFILIANDDPVMLANMVEQLQARGCSRIVTAADGVSALKLVREVPPQVVVASVSLSGLDGFQLSRLLNSSAHRAGGTQTPVILTSLAYRDLVARELARTSCAVDCVHPTQDPDRLYRLIEDVVQQLHSNRSKESITTLVGQALIVTSDEHSSALLREILHGYGWGSHILQNVSEAREAVAQQEFELAVLDGEVSETVLTGMIASLRAGHPETVIFALCPGLDEARMLRLMQVGADDCLVKPLGAAAVSIACFNALNRHSFLRIHRQFQQRLEELRDMGEYLDMVIRYSQEAIFSCDVTGHVRIWNKGAERMYGYAAEEIVGGIVDDFLDPPEFTRKSPDVVRILQQRGGSFVEQEIMRRKKDGEIFPVNATYSAILDAEGACIGFSVIERDVGTHRALEAEKIKSARLRAITQTAVTANDQINTPLGVILGYAQFLQRKMINLAPEDVAALEIIQQQVLKIKGIMNKLKLMSDPIVKNYSIEGVTMLDLTQSK